MKKSSVVLLCTALTITTLITTGCTPKTSVERHARQYVYAVGDDGLDSNFYVKEADNIRSMVSFFHQFRDMGVKDKTTGLSRDDAMKRASLFRSEEFLKSIQSVQVFAGRTYANSSTPSPKKLKAMGDAISATYMDGYEGRP
ncbi:entry exclusion protein 2 [Limnobaculum zhutongyuii]|uniref:Entry exclusion protein 2 n=1 Tax=Limnobaculum zhutongyuii TaxID=2498113 RepID=A0A411WLY5_9GAMM|nr:Exc2 family lipoprotein [Limnobaculum zhutongyuii]QBH97170.1 entry exclusion protein 2 [Limnobaculum zhutongyuii]TQS88429.1 entry exclusion protein 2 [Limnobaculum zhutongyuii]